MPKGGEVDFQSGKESEPLFDTFTGNVTHGTPKKWKQKEKQQENVNVDVSHVSSTAWESLEDQESDSFWISCKEKPANARVLLLVSMMGA